MAKLIVKYPRPDLVRHDLHHTGYNDAQDEDPILIGRLRPPGRCSFLPEWLELASSLYCGEGCLLGHPVCCDLRLDACKFSEPCLGACGLDVQVNLRLFVKTDAG
jgi:hypothetical protein